MRNEGRGQLAEEELLARDLDPGASASRAAEPIDNRRRRAPRAAIA
jgi:hypothetical protein